MIEFGVITKVNYETSTATVTIESLEDYKLENVPVMQKLTGKSKSFVMPDVGTTVVVGFSEDRRPILLGCYFTEINLSPSKSNKYIKSFSDGTTIEYDIENSKLTGNIKGDIEVKVSGNAEISSDSNITLKASKIKIDGELETTAGIKVGAGIETTQDVKISGIGMLTHIHVTPNGPSGPPQSGGA